MFISLKRTYFNQVFHVHMFFALFLIKIGSTLPIYIFHQVFVILEFYFIFICIYFTRVLHISSCANLYLCDKNMVQELEEVGGLEELEKEISRRRKSGS